MNPRNKIDFPFDGIVLEKGLGGREFLAVHSWAVLNNVKLRYATFCQDNFLPVGSVSFVQDALGIDVIPDYYPDFAKSLIKRKIWRSDRIPSKACFVKPDTYKAFNGYVKEKGAVYGGGDVTYGYWCSEITEFNNEWRLYICNGEILDKGWYSGDDDNLPCPEVDLDLQGVYGALDIGETEKGIQLVEFHHPFSIGWYGTDVNAYVRFLAEGYEKMKKFC